MIRVRKFVHAGVLSALAVLLSHGWSPSARADVPVPLPPIELVVDTSALKDGSSARLEGALEEELLAEIADEGYLVVHDGASARIEVQVAASAADETHYLVSVILTLDGRRELIADEQLCETCTEAEVRNMAADYVEDAIERLDLEFKPVPACPPPAGAQARNSEQSGDVRLGPIAFSGALTIVGGAALLIGGGAVYSMDSAGTEVTPSPKRVGSAIMGLGIGIAAGGAVALVLDMFVLQPRRERKFSVTPSVSTSRAGISISGSF